MEKIMKQKIWHFLVLGLGFFSLSFALFPVTEAKGQKISIPVPLFFQPKQGITTSTQSSGSRGAGGMIYPRIHLLAYPGYSSTTQKSPVFYGFLSDSWKGMMSFTVREVPNSEEMIDSEVGELLYEEEDLSKTDFAISGGFFAISLEKCGISLKTGKKYEWLVSLVPDPDNRSADVVAKAPIFKIDPTNILLKHLKEAKGKEHMVYAQEEIFYDAISEISKKIENQKGNRRLRNIRAEFLKQVGLTKLASYNQELQKAPHFFPTTCSDMG